MKKQKGFTLIELLVVVAVIGILASVVLVNLGGARDTAQDSNIISALSQTRSVGESIMARDLSYSGLCLGTNLNTSNEELNTLQGEIISYGGGVTCYASDKSYCISSLLNETGKHYCFTSSGKTGKSDNPCSSATDGCEL